ncbi:MAG: hypothetical protein PHC68_07245 [Syntrophorhabdaceae bacterium]|nr:hypothetical protein [Syntrophorhabdaceae bacterium]
MKDSVCVFRASDLPYGWMADIKREFPVKYMQMKAAIRKYGPARVSFIFDKHLRPISQNIAY